MKKTVRKSVILISIMLAVITAYAVFRNQIWIKVVDGVGQPIPDAIVRFSWSTGEPWGPSLRSGKQHHKVRTSDSNGLVSVHISDNSIGVQASAVGYYRGILSIVNDSTRKHQSSSSALPFALKKIQSPTTFIGKNANIILPLRAGEAGYDFIEGDLVAPHGKGQHEDIKLRWSYDPERGGGYHKRALWDFSFKSPSGIQAHRPSPLDISSSLVSNLAAPANGYLESFRIAEDHAGFGERGPWGPVVYYFKTERSGEMRYGKIMGEPEIIFYSNGTTVIKLIYMINPTGSISLEPDFDRSTFPKQNDWEEPYKLPEST